jgi:uncharacterized protein (UPF0248 family)
MEKSEAEIKEVDAKLKEVLDKIRWEDYIDYGSIRIQVRDGKRTMLAVERTYIE